VNPSSKEKTVSQLPDSPNIPAAADTPRTAPLTAEQTVEQLRVLLANIPGVPLLTARERQLLRRRSAQMPESELRAAIHVVDASDKVAQAIGQPAEDVRQLLDDASGWTPVESELRGLLKAVSDANLVRRQRAAVVAMQAYGIGQQLTRDPANAVLVPHVQEVHRLKALRRRKTSSGGDAPASPVSPKTPNASTWR
jgi:hypothetical protein